MTEADAAGATSILILAFPLSRTCCKACFQARSFADPLPKGKKIAQRAFFSPLFSALLLASIPMNADEDNAISPA